MTIEFTPASCPRALLKSLCLLAFLFLLARSETEGGISNHQAVARYGVEAIDSPDGRLIPQAINDRGQIVGYIQDKSGHQRAFLWQNGKLMRLPDLGGHYTHADAINNIGQVVGTAQNRRGHSRPVLWEKGRIEDLGGPGGRDGEARGINDRGEVIGSLEDRRRRFRWFVNRRGRIARIRVQRGLSVLSVDAINSQGEIAGLVALKGTNASEPTVRICLIRNSRAVSYGPPTRSDYTSEPVALNSKGMIVGNGSYVEGCRVYTIKNGKYEALDRDDFHGVSALNDQGQYVGRFCTGNVIQDGPYRAILWEDNQKYDLNELIPRQSNWVLEQAHAINNRGEIVGTGTYNGRPRAFKLVPARAEHGELWLGSHHLQVRLNIESSRDEQGAK